MSRLNGQHTEQKRTPAQVTAGMDQGAGIAGLMRDWYIALARVAFEDANDIPGLDVAFDLENPYVQTVLDQLAKDVRAVADTTRQQIADLVGRQASEGWSNDELARQIESLGADMTRSRSVTIARTESAAGYSQGSLAAYQDSGVVSAVEWLIGPDPCDICIDLDGQRVELGGEFAPGLTAPPAHPRCTCAVAPIVD